MAGALTTRLPSPPSPLNTADFSRGHEGDRRLPDADRDPAQGHGGAHEDPLLRPPRLPRPAPAGQNGGLEKGDRRIQM
jgi:hypothetical protein